MKHGVSVVLLLLAMPASARQGDAAGDPLVVVAALRDAIINPVTARYIVRTIDEAERRQAAAVLIELDTPGGLVDSTRAITRRILDSRVPVVVYVFPPGGRAASAGLFITIAAHVAAMAPGTNIGAAHPVQAGGAPFPQQPAPSQPEQPGSKGDDKPAPASPMEDKVLNDTVAWARSLAELRGRNVDWVERAVRDSESLPASEAKARNVVDLIATDPRALLDEIHGRRVTMNSGSVELKVRHARTDAVEMWWGEEVLSLLAHPNVAFLLLIFGFYGILLELYTPGWGVGGTVGVICLILGFFAMAVLPINYVGLALLVIGLLLFVAEAFVVSHGVLALGGVACLSIGGLMLVDSTPGFIRVSPWLVLPVALATAAISMFLVSRAVGAYRLAPITGGEALLRESGIADGPFERQLDRYVGVVRTHGELWQATSLEAIADRQRVRIDNRQGLVLHVRPLGEAPETAGEVRS